jgi:uncharacterized membrane protein YbaN (DUF454 family)
MQKENQITKWSKNIMRPFLFSLGVFSFLLGIIGIFLPIMPTVPFILVATYCFNKSSPRIHAWIIAIPYFGKMVDEWEQHKMIRPRTKVIATTSITVGFFLSSLALRTRPILIVVVFVCLASAIIFILTRSSGPNTNEISKPD